VIEDLLPPRYQNPNLIGRGGMGDIYRGTDSVLGREVAIKILAERYSQNQSVRQRFKREALAAARLSGEPSIVTIFDVGEHHQRPYIVMEYLSGGSLDEVLRKEGAQQPQQVFTWLEQAGGALDAAHERGVVHRDVKPGNLMLDREGNVYVADFGIASAAGMDSLTMTGTVLGTAGYLSPEQAQGERATAASDRYALAVVAFELLTGSRPFAADSPTAEAAAHVHAPVPSVSAKTGLPRELDGVFERALAKDPARRFETCEGFVVALRDAFAAAAGETRRLAPVPQPPTVATRPLPPPAAVRSLWPLLLALLAAGAVAGVALAWLLTRGNDNSPAPTRVITHVRTVTTRGQVSTVEQPTTVTTAPTTAPAGQSGEALNDAGYAKMQAGDFEGALPLLEQAVQKLEGTGKLYEAYAKYNLAYTRFQLGRCDGVLDLLDQAEAIEGPKDAIDRLREQAGERC
jgi:tRNA A-37 threonylcarbamoyl transferase component Bud32/tetratricopeptide (TPR) repeat protein